LAQALERLDFVSCLAATFGRRSFGDYSKFVHHALALNWTKARNALEVNFDRHFGFGAIGMLTTRPARS
jgi:hypothetical protein